MESKRDAKRAAETKIDRKQIALRTAEHYNEQGKLAFAQSDHTRASQWFQKAADLPDMADHPMRVSYLCNQVAACIRAKQTPEALTAAQSAVQLDPRSAKAWLRQAEALLAVFAFAPATASLMQALECDDDHKFEADISRLQKEIEQHAQLYRQRIERATFNNSQAQLSDVFGGSGSGSDLPLSSVIRANTVDTSTTVEEAKNKESVIDRSSFPPWADAFLHWLGSHGVSLHPMISIRIDNHLSSTATPTTEPPITSCRSCRNASLAVSESVRRNLQKSQLLFQIPRSTFLSQDDAKMAPASDTDDCKVSCFGRLALAIWEQFELGVASPWHAYLQTLPGPRCTAVTRSDTDAKRKDSTPSPDAKETEEAKSNEKEQKQPIVDLSHVQLLPWMGWTDDEPLQCIQGSHAHRVVETMRQEWKTDREWAQRVGCDPSRFAWAYQIARTRSYRIQNKAMLVPLADLMDYAVPELAPVDATYLPAEGRFVAANNSAVSSGTPLHSFCGPRSNAELWATYGITLSSNPHNQAELRSVSDMRWNVSAHYDHLCTRQVFAWARAYVTLALQHLANYFRLDRLPVENGTLERKAADSTLMQPTSSEQETIQAIDATSAGRIVSTSHEFQVLEVLAQCARRSLEQLNVSESKQVGYQPLKPLIDDERAVLQSYIDLPGRTRTFVSTLEGNARALKTALQKNPKLTAYERAWIAHLSQAIATKGRLKSQQRKKR